MAGNKNNSAQEADIILTDRVYDPETIRATANELYGGTEGINHIYLKRYNESGQIATLRKFVDFPEIEAVRREYGGGRYEIWVTYNDESTKSGRNLGKYEFLIEGEPIFPANGNKPVENPVKPEPSFNFDKELQQLMQMAKVKMFMNGGETAKPAGVDSSIQLIIEGMKQQHESTMKLFETMITKMDNPLSKEIVQSFVQKNGSTELDNALKIVKLVQSGGTPSESDWGWLKEYAPLLLPVAQKVLGGGGAAPMNGAPTGGPQTGQNPLQQILGAIKSVADSVANIDRRLKEVEDAVFLPEGEQQPGEIYNNGLPPENSFHQVQTENLNKEQAMNYFEGIQQNLANDLKDAPEAEKLEQLKKYINLSGPKTTYEWCLKYGVIKDLAEFNEWMNKAGFQPHNPQ